MMREELMKIVPVALPMFALIFHAGKQSEKIEDLYSRMEVEHKGTREILRGIESKLVIIDQDIKNILSKSV